MLCLFPTCSQMEGNISNQNGAQRKPPTFELIFRTIFPVFGRLMRRQAVKFMTKKKASYADINVEDFYTETVSGAGGPPKGLERDLITKFFGDGDFHGHGDHEADCLYVSNRYGAYFKF